MKNSITKFLAVCMVVFVFVSQIGVSFAQSYDYDYNYGSYDWGSSYNYNNDSYSWGDTTGYDYSNWTYQDPGSYNYNYGSYTNPNVDVVGTDCIGCGSSYDYSGWTYQNIDDYSYNYGSYTNPNVDVVGTDCVGCGYSYDNYSYTTPSWTGYDYNYTSPTYTTPSYNYTSPTYTSPTYTYTNYTYTTPTYTNPVVVTPTTPAPCPAGYARLSNGTCGCPAGTIAAQPDGCRPITTGGMCPMDAQLCSNGTWVGRTGPNCQFVCPTTPVTRCSDGLPPVNGSCVRTTTIPTVNNTICSDGQPPINGSCVRTNVVPTINNTICSDGQPAVNGSCVRTVIAPTVTYQVCWDGSRIPLTSVCPTQYKVCANGTSVPVNQTCYYGNTYVPYTPPVTIKFNNVITSVATEITNSSARCNGIGLIASGAQSTGWFEYGETPNLGRETGKANIGSSPTAPFSNVLVNLKPSTTYYCRAVMQNQYGVVKGEVVAFTTKAKSVAYVKPVTKTTVKTTTTKVSTSKKNEIVCVDGQVVTIGSKGAAELINEGQKLITLHIEKVGGTLAAGSPVTYKLAYKNVSDEALRNVTMKVLIPQEITLAQASHGSYDPTTHVLAVSGMSIPAYGEGVIQWTGTVAKDATVGKSLVMNAYANYSVPGSQVEDEVTAYVVGSVVPATDGVGTSTGAKKVVGGAQTDRGFLPDSLVEWLALIAILFIIFILGRSVYSSYSADKKAAH